MTGTPPRTTRAPRRASSPQAAGHEQVVFCQDEPTGLRAIIAIHSTALGPALGGTRFYPYANEADALADVLEPLARDVLQGRARRPRPRRRQGRHHRRPGHATRPRRCCAPTAGSWSRSAAATTPRATSAPTPRTWTSSPGSATTCTGRTVAHGGAGDSSVLTAYGVFQGMRAAAEVTWGAPTLHGRTVGVAGVGKVGRHLVEPPRRGRRRRRRHRRRPGRGRRACSRPPRGRRGRRHRRRWSRAELDVYAPCALGGALTDDVVRLLERADRLRRREQPARPPGHREAARRTAACSTRPTTSSTPAA